MTDLSFHPLADIFPLMEGVELDALVEDIYRNGLREPIVLHEGKILDGRNRYRACMKIVEKAEAQNYCGQLYQPQFKELEPRIGVGIDPYAYVISANIHRRHLTAEQRRGLIAKVLKAEPRKSDRQIAETVKASPTTVGSIRKKLEATGEVSNLDTRTDTKGRQQPARKPATAAEIRARRKAKHEPVRVRPEAAAQRREIELPAHEAAAMEFAVELRQRVGAENFGWIAAQLKLIDPFDLVDAISDLALKDESS